MSYSARKRRPRNGCGNRKTHPSPRQGRALAERPIRPRAPLTTNARPRDSNTIANEHSWAGLYRYIRFLRKLHIISTSAARTLKQDAASVPCVWCSSRWPDPRYHGRPGMPCVKCIKKYLWLNPDYVQQGQII
jgi:hypothetical protein